MEADPANITADQCNFLTDPEWAVSFSMQKPVRSNAQPSSPWAVGFSHPPAGTMWFHWFPRAEGTQTMIMATQTAFVCWVWVSKLYLQHQINLKRAFPCSSQWTQHHTCSRHHLGMVTLHTQYQERLASTSPLSRLCLVTQSSSP